MSLKKGDICPECGKGSMLEEELEFVCDGCGAKEKKEKHKKMDSVARRDVQELYWNLMTDKMEDTPEGYLKGTACVTNIGVFPYIMDDGSVRFERRLSEDVCNWESLDTLKMKPISNNHPTVAITADNYQTLTIGSVGSHISNDGVRVYAPVVIADAKAVADVKNGKIAFSCGYSCDIEEGAGTYLGMHYDVTQRNIRYNHLALVQKGRAGDDAVMRMDGAGVYVSIQNVQENTKMAKLNLDGVDFEVAEVVASKHVEMKQKIEKADADLVLVNAELSKATADRDMALEGKQKLDEEIVALKEKLDKAPAEAEAKIAARVALVKMAQDCGVEATAEMSVLDVQKAVVLKVSPKCDLATKDEVYIQARFDAAVEILVGDKKQDQANADTMAEVSVKTEDKIDTVAILDQAVKNLENRWQTK